MKKNIIVSFITTFMLFIGNSQAFENQLANQQYNNANPLRIAVAANFTPVLRSLLTSFTKQTGINTQIISGASGAMFLQLQHGAPFDIFLSADSVRPKTLEQAGLTVTNSRKTYAIGQLALFSTANKEPNPNLLKQLNAVPKRFAIANPDTAPYGKAAKEVLLNLGLWQQYEPKLIKGLNIGQTFSQIRSKAVTQGIVAKSQLVLNNLSGIAIPTSYHQPIEQQLVIIKTSKQQVAAHKLSHFLLSPENQDIIASYGYVARLHSDSQLAPAVKTSELTKND